MRNEADIIWVASQAHVPLPVAEVMELWEIAAAAGMHRTETLQERNIRDITEQAQKDWEETGEQRMAKMAEIAERRKAKRRNR